MTDDELRQFIERQEARATREFVAQEQAMAMDYYLRRPFGNEEEGRSQVVSSDVFDVVEGKVPAIMGPFIASSDLVQFTPQGAEDEEAAKQESDYVNYVVTQKNDAFTQFLAWVKVGLLQKNGIVKYWWDTTRKVSVETYRGISVDMLTVFTQDPEIKILQATANPPEPPIADPGMANQLATPPEPTYDVKIRHTKKDGEARFEVVPPEEFRIIGRDPNPQKASFVQHVTRKTISELREMGYDVADDLADTNQGDPTMGAQFTARNQQGQTEQFDNSDGNGNLAMRELWFRETYCYVDYDDDGIAELRKVCMVGSTQLANEETDEIPFAAWTPCLQPFQFDGRCPADEAIEFQDVGSTLWRQALDNIYSVNNNRVAVNEKVNLDDVLDNQIAGVVRIKGQAPVGGDIMAMPVQPLGQIIVPMIELVDAKKENRTGFSRYNQGSSDLGNQKTLGEVQIVSGASNMRAQLEIHALAEQGMKPLMVGMHRLLREHATKADTVRLRGKWVTLDPRTWVQREDMTVTGVGLGTLDKQSELGVQSEIMKMQAGLASTGIVTPENQYNAASKFVELSGEKNVDKYFTSPDKMPPQQPPDPMQDPKVMLAVAGHKLEEAKFMAETQQKTRQLDQADRALDQVDQKQGIDAQNASIDALERLHKQQIATEAHVRDMAAPHPQALAAGNQALQAQQQGHDQTVDATQLAQSQQQIDNPPEASNAAQ